MSRHNGTNRLEEAQETSPLLSDSYEAQSEPTEPLSHRTRCTWPWIHVVALCITLAVVSDIGECLYLVPRVRLFESVTCTNYYRQHDPSLVRSDGSVDEQYCKIDPIQDYVSTILGWQYFFEAIPAILLPVPYAYFADKHGRKWVTFSAMLGITFCWASPLFFIGVLHLPLPYVWLSSLFYIIGGGMATGTTMLTTIIADVAPPESRSTVFFYRFCTDLIAECFVPSITAFLMTKNLWIPLIAAIFFQGLGTLMVLFVPETAPLPSSSKDPLDSDNQPPPNTNWKDRIKQIEQSFRFATRDPAVAALIFTFLISKVGRQSSNILLQYVSKAYGWTLSKAGLLLALKAGVNIALFTLILPAITSTTILRKSPAAKDLLIAKTSITLMIAGSSILFLAHTASVMILGLITYTLGAGFTPIVRSLVTGLVETRHGVTEASNIGSLYALIAVMEGVGSMIAGPGMAWAFRLGMRFGSDWLGLPFGFAAVLFGAIAVVVSRIRV